MAPGAVGLALAIACCLAPAASAAQPRPLPPIDGTRLGARRDSLVALATTGAVGWWRMSRSPEAAGGWRAVEVLAVEDIADLTTLVVTDSALALRRLRQTGEAWDQPVLVALDVRDGRLTGQATRVGGRGATLHTVDTPVAPLPDLNAVPLLVLATPWGAGMAGSWRVLDGATGTEVVLAVQVEGLEPATTASPAAWRIAIRRDGVATRYRVSSQPPWRMLGVATDGAPFRLVLP
jgi:hypothetical protein